MKRIKMKATMAGPAGVMADGQEYAVSDVLADMLVAAHYAELVAPPKETAVAAAPVPAKADAPKVTVLSGVSAARFDSLVAMGIETIADMADADAETVAAGVHRVGVQTAQAWIDEAKRMMEA